jgi:hypothetical protein
MRTTKWVRPPSLFYMQGQFDQMTQKAGTIDYQAALLI